MIKSSADVVFLFFLRYALIVHPLKCRKYLTNSFVISASLVLWGYSFIAIFLKYFIVVMNYNYRRVEDIKLDLIPSIIFILIVTVLPITIIFVLPCFKMKTPRSSTVSTAITRKMSCVIIIIAVLNVFLVCYLTLYFQVTHCSDWCIPVTLLSFSYFMCHIIKLSRYFCHCVKTVLIKETGWSIN